MYSSFFEVSCIGKFSLGLGLLILEFKEDWFEGKLLLLLLNVVQGKEKVDRKEGAWNFFFSFIAVCYRGEFFLGQACLFSCLWEVVRPFNLRAQRRFMRLNLVEFEGSEKKGEGA